MVGSRDELDRLLRDDHAQLRHPDVFLPCNLVLVVMTAEMCDHDGTSALIRSTLERLRGRVGSPYPALANGLPAELGLGVLDLIDGDHDAAVRELEAALVALDANECRLMEPRVQLYRAQALLRRGDREEAEAALAAATVQSRALGLGWLSIEIARVRAELDGRPVPSRGTGIAPVRPGRALQARTGRRALAALVRHQDDAALERRFASPRRQRGLLRAMARGYQPEYASNHHGAVIVYTLEAYAIEAPPDAPWRWAIELGEHTARVLDSAPLQSDVSVEFGLADWVRIMAGLQTPITSMAAGRCRIEGDALLALRLEGMFTG